jgi:hypothetical protein avisC_01207
MRLGRPLAAASVTAAAIGASLAASPALADDNFQIADDQPNIVSASETAFTVSGTGCSGTDAAVGIALYAPDGTMSTVVKAEPSADGSWSATLDLPELIKSTGVEATSDGWSIGAGCVVYGEQKGQDQEAIVFDDTDVNGTFEIYTDENGAQTFTVDATGFSANEEVSVSLIGKDDPSITYSIGKITADAEGKVHGTLPAPTGVADGQYLLTLEGSRYGESATSQKVITVQNGAFDLADVADGGNGIAGDGDGDSTATPAAPSTSGSKVPANTGATQAASTSNKPLARTGANGLLIGGIAVALAAIGGGALVMRRRKA